MARNMDDLEFCALARIVAPVWLPARQSGNIPCREDLSTFVLSTFLVGFCNATDCLRRYNSPTNYMWDVCILTQHPHPHPYIPHPVRIPYTLAKIPHLLWSSSFCLSLPPILPPLLLLPTYSLMKSMLMMQISLSRTAQIIALGWPRARPSS